MRTGLVDEADLALPLPALRKARMLWTGDQVRCIGFMVQGIAYGMGPDRLVMMLQFFRQPWHCMTLCMHSTWD